MAEHFHNRESLDLNGINLFKDHEGWQLSLRLTADCHLFRKNAVYSSWRKGENYRIGFSLGVNKQKAQLKLCGWQEHQRGLSCLGSPLPISVALGVTGSISLN